jgi:NADPH2:quinone reductase
MHAAVYTRFGAAEVIEIQDVPEPELGTDDVLVDVAYAGLNRADVLERRGFYGTAASEERPIGGLEYSGTVAMTGSRVRTLHPGDRVFGIVSGRAHAEKLAVNAATAMRVPDELDLESAAAIPEAFMTAWDALFRAGGFRLGMTVVVHAAGSGVGLAALALAKAAGGTTVGTSRSASKLERAAAHGLDYGALLHDDWPAVALRVTRGRGADVVLDFVGAPIFDRNVRALATGGRIVQIGLLGGASGAIALGPFMAKRATFIGTLLRVRTLDEKAALARAFEAEIVPLFARGVLRPVIDRVFPLSEIRAAHRHMEEDANFGKILLKIA